MNGTAVKISEQTILQEIKQALRYSGFYVIRHVGSAFSHKGLPDLEAIKDGKTIYIEVKQNSGRQSPHQVQFQKDIEEHGGTYILARCLEDVEHLLDGRIKFQ